MWVCAETGVLKSGMTTVTIDGVQAFGCKTWLPLSDALTHEVTAEALGVGAASLMEMSSLVAGGLIGLFVAALSGGLAAAWVKRAEREV